MWKSPISSWWCEISIWLLWDTIGKLVLDFQISKHFDLGWPWRGNFKVAKVKMALSSKRLLLGPGCLWTRKFTITDLEKVWHGLWPWVTFSGSFECQECENRLYLCEGARQAYVYIETLMGVWPKVFRIRNDLWPWFSFTGHECENRFLAPWLGYPATAGCLVGLSLDHGRSMYINTYPTAPASPVSSPALEKLRSKAADSENPLDN